MYAKKLFVLGLKFFLVIEIDIVLYFIDTKSFLVFRPNWGLLLVTRHLSLSRFKCSHTRQTVLVDWKP
jgi:hypothetical protein